MERPGEKLRRARERLGLTYRDVVEASRKIAARRKRQEFSIALSRLADIENKGTVPTIYRLYTLCAIYRLDWREALRWYDVPLELQASDGVQIRLDATHAVNFAPDAAAMVPQPPDRELDLNQTAFLSHLIRRWGKMPLGMLAGQDLRRFHYGFVGLADWSMYPILRPGSFVLIDQSKRRIAAGGWTGEIDRPIYFLEHRRGYCVGWCTLLSGRLLLESHPDSGQPPRLFEQSEIDVVGQVAGVAMLLEARSRRHARTSTTPAASPNP